MPVTGLTTSTLAVLTNRYHSQYGEHSAWAAVGEPPSAPARDSSALSSQNGLEKQMIRTTQPPLPAPEQAVYSWNVTHDISEELNRQLEDIINTHGPAAGAAGKEGTTMVKEQPENTDPPDNEDGDGERPLKRRRENPQPLESHPQPKSLSATKSKNWRRNSKRIR